MVRTTTTATVMAKVATRNKGKRIAKEDKEDKGDKQEDEDDEDDEDDEGIRMRRNGKSRSIDLNLTSFQLFQ